MLSKSDNISSIVLVVVKDPQIAFIVRPLCLADHTNTIAFLRRVLPDAEIYENELNLGVEDSSILSVAEAGDSYNVVSSGAQLKSLRKKLGVTQQWLANEVGTSKSAISAMEANTRPISTLMAQRLSKILKANSVTLDSRFYYHFSKGEE